MDRTGTPRIAARTWRIATRAWRIAMRTWRIATRTRRIIMLFVLLLSAAAAAGQTLYWESPHDLVPRGGRFPQVGSGGGVAALVYQESGERGERQGDVHLSLATSRNGASWETVHRFAGPYPYNGNEASLFSLAVDRTGTVFTAVATAERSVEIYRFRPGDERPVIAARLISPDTSVAPRLFVKEDGGLLLFITQDIEDSLSIFCARSDDGTSWSPFLPLIKEPSLKPNFLPFHTTFAGREYVVFQSLLAGDRKTYQLYLTISDDGGQSWSDAIWLSDFAEEGGGQTAPQYFDNQRPFITPGPDGLLLTWERNYVRGRKQIYLIRLDREGNRTGDVEQVTSGDRECNFPRITVLGGREFVSWFDNRRGENQVVLAEKRGLRWVERVVSGGKGEATYGRPFMLDGELFLLWENRRGASTGVVLLRPDRSAPAPEPVPSNFKAGARVRGNVARFRWTMPDDSSGIAGYSYLWTRDPDAEPPRELLLLADRRSAEFTADEDGPWYLHLAAQDYAGNWSSTATAAFFRDTTPPGPVRFEEPATDGRGFLASNTFTLRWEPPKDGDVAGYTYAIRYVSGNHRRELPEKSAHAAPPSRILTEDGARSYRNLDNGLWVFTVRAVDGSGNIGEPASVPLRMNKYVPVTYISYLQDERDEIGRVGITIKGRGFTAGGIIEEVILDRDGLPPWDYSFPRESGAFRVLDDRTLEGPVVEDVREGTYRVGLVHPSRGLSISKPLITMETTGAVKFGDFSNNYAPGWIPLRQDRFTVSANDVLMLLILLFLAAALFFAAFRLRAVVQEGLALQAHARSLLTGPAESSIARKEALLFMKRKGTSLAVKFALLIMILMIMVVMMVSLPLGYYMMNAQERTLAEGLQEKVIVLLESLTSGARTYMPLENTLETGLLPAQVDALDEALYATITGASMIRENEHDAVWASNDPDIGLKLLDTDEVRIRESVVMDRISPHVDRMEREINETARTAVGGFSRELEQLSREALQYVARSDDASRQALAEIQETIRILDTRVNRELAVIGDCVASEPAFDTGNLDPDRTDYVFYKPIVYRQGGEDVYFRGLVRLGVSTESIYAEIDAARNRLVTITGVVAVVAALLGVIGSLLLASITVNPIKKLVAGIEVIRDTADHSSLRGHRITIRTRDEISILAETINEMTAGLVRAADANKELIVGKEVQKMFIPLVRDAEGRKLTTGIEENEHGEFFGYYEGAKGVSGDYFDFMKLDGEHYAIMKCDVAGKGVPAALIMIEVATIFLNYFKDWTLAGYGMRLEPLVYRINDLLEERGFKGRFAALTVAIMNIRTGDCHLCNAGDNKLHYYDSGSRSMRVHTLPQAPASGVFPSDLVRLQSGFRQEKRKLAPGDILLLFTDGLEESKRFLRDERFMTFPTKQEGGTGGQGGGQAGKDEKAEELASEEFGIERVQAVVNAVCHRGTYRLVKERNPVPGEEFLFDFSGCRGTAEEAVTALVAVEKLFRIYSDPSAGPKNRIFLDRKIDAFLARCFRQYRSVFVHAADDADYPEYRVFTHLREDEQYDDLTILGIRKK